MKTPTPPPDPDEIVTQQRQMYQAFERDWRQATQDEMSDYWMMEKARWAMEKASQSEDKPVR